jgi:hypothetical protein
MRITGVTVQPVRVTYDETISGTHVVLRLRTDDGLVSFVSRIGGTKIKPLCLRPGLSPPALSRLG